MIENGERRKVLRGEVAASMVQRKEATMPVDRRIWESPFYDESVPRRPCPCCGFLAPGVAEGRKPGQ